MSVRYDLLKAVPLGAEAAFPKEEFDGRIAKLRNVLANEGIDLYLTSSPENMFYLTGHQTPGYYTFQCVGIPQSGEPFLVARVTEAYNARLNTYIEDVSGFTPGEDSGVFFAKMLKERGWAGKCVAIDCNAAFLTVNLYRNLTAACGEMLDGANLVEPFRRVKSKLELESMQRAADAAGAGMRAGIAATRPGCTDNEVAAAVMSASILAGSEYMGMEPFVTAGRRAGVVHTTWRRHTVNSGDILVIENAACYNRYHSALFRTIAVGKVPQIALDQYEVCREALAAGMTKAKPGVTCAEVHNAVEGVIERAGFSDGYRKRAGYSMGISFAPDWGEGNLMSVYKTVNIELQPGMCFHTPVTLREWYQHTVAVSETFVITDTGCRALNDIPQDLVHV